ncbi:thiamine phosphate synthase [Salibacterium halotolerans]|uniref:Thiazole tautomerase (Transcriptional regulator TenI) n=1 Tax=Salibacterium halotolerans TaxID=1884432 RepID=A0A1I5TUL3_9BACI|nr:thiamine phosphate synthase [Salibacterium halotolerans]SFP86733.1 thiazole tautomerase (transcriptional regulator TenI) [Salibacterium halotolerans]
MLHVISTGRQSFWKWLDITVRIHEEVDYVHVREKTWSEAQLQEAVHRLEAEGVPRTRIILNNHPELVSHMKLGGVHFPETIPLSKAPSFSAWKGCSIHSEDAAVRKEREGADYLFFGHIFETDSKAGQPARGLHALRQLASAVSIPVTAIGGITPENTRRCLENGASGVAVMSGIYEAPDPKAAAKAYRDALRKGGRP